MSASGITGNEWNTVTSPRFGLRNSAVFRHVGQNMSQYEDFVRKNPNTLSIFQPYSLTAPTEMILIDLKPSDSKGLFDLLPPEIRENFPNNTVIDEHIRIDKKFGAKSSKEAKRALWFQWHYTLRGKFKDKGIVAHVYFHYSECTGVFFKFQNKNIDVTYQMENAAKKLAQKALDVMLVIIADVQRHKETLRVKMEEGFEKFGNYDLRHISDDELHNALDIFRKLNDEWLAYLEDTIDKRFELWEEYILEIINKRCMASLNKLTVEDSKPPESINEQITTESLTPSARYQKSVVTVKPLNKKITQEEALAQMRKRCLELNAKAKEITTAKEAIEFDVKVKELNFNTQCLYVEAGIKDFELKCLGLIKIIQLLPNMYVFFKRFVDSKNISQAKKIFSSAQVYIPPNFYYGLLNDLSRKVVTQEEENSWIDFCEFLYEHSEDYRLLLPVLNSITSLFIAKDNTNIAVSSFINMPIVKGHKMHKLFALWVQQNGMTDWVGYNENYKSAYLLYVFCALSVNSCMNGFIEALLAINPIVENPHPFAQELQCVSVSEQDKERTSSLLSRTNSSSSSTSKKTAEDQTEVAQYYKDRLGSIINCSSALAAYIEAPYHHEPILRKLASMTSTINLIYSLANLSFNGSDYALIFSNKPKSGIWVETNKNLMINKAKIESKNVGITQSLGISFSHDDRMASRDMVVLMDELKSRMSHCNDAQLQLMMTQLAENRDIYIKLGGNSMRALSANLAIVLVAAYSEPTLDIHRQVLDVFITAADIYVNSDDLYQEQSPRLNAAYVQLKHGSNFADYSKHHETLVNHQPLIDAKEKLAKIKSSSVASSKSKLKI